MTRGSVGRFADRFVVEIPATQFPQQQLGLGERFLQTAEAGHACGSRTEEAIDTKIVVRGERTFAFGDAIRTYESHHSDGGHDPAGLFAFIA